MYQDEASSNSQEIYRDILSDDYLNCSHRDGKNLVFIVGSPRSGTTWLQRLLAAHPQVRTGQESYLFSNYIGPQFRKWKYQRNPIRTRRVGLGCFMDEEEFYRYLKYNLNFLLEKIIGETPKGSIFVEKTPAHAKWVTEIAELLPEAKFIHIIRDPRDVVCSLLAASKSSWAKHWAPSDALGAIRVWRAHVEAAERSFAALSPRKVYRIRYEQLQASTPEELSRLFEFLNLYYEKEQLNEIVKRNSSKNARSEQITEIPIRGEEAKATGHTAVSEPKDFIRKAQAGTWRDELSFFRKLLLRMYVFRMNKKGSNICSIIEDYYKA